jgi:hypothetical protein
MSTWVRASNVRANALNSASLYMALSVYGFGRYRSSAFSASSVLAPARMHESASAHWP